MENLSSSLEKIIDKDKRYKKDAYEFLLEALAFTQNKEKAHRHVSGQELLLGIKEYALTRFGGMSKTVFEHWGIKNTEDFGEIVFNMVNAGLLSKTETDSKNDFKGVYNFTDAFRATFDIKPAQPNYPQ